MSAATEASPPPAEGVISAATEVPPASPPAPTPPAAQAEPSPQPDQEAAAEPAPQPAGKLMRPHRRHPPTAEPAEATLQPAAAEVTPPAPVQAPDAKPAAAEPPAAPAPVQEARAAAEVPGPPPAPQAPAVDTSGLDKIVGQMLMVGFRGLTPEEAWPQKLAAQIKAGTVGGVLFMSQNIQSPQQLKTLTSYLQRAKTDTPALFAVDQEGGIVQRLSAEKGFAAYPTARQIGQSNDPLTAYAIYGRLASELVRYGFNMNLAPVVDLDRNADSPIIAGKERSFGPRPKHVGAFAKAFCLAHQEAGVLTVLKHFPGHGSTPFDTHTQPVDVGASWDKAELEPYSELIESRTAKAIMVGHIANTVTSGEAGLPSSLSPQTIRQVLRHDLGFAGVVISDDLEMGAIRARYSLEESAVKAIKAGNDIIILSNQTTADPDLPDRIIAAVKKAVVAGELSRDELQASYDRIIALKQQLPGSPSAKNGANKRASADRGKTTPAR